MQVSLRNGHAVQARSVQPGGVPGKLVSETARLVNGQPRSRRRPANCTAFRGAKAIAAPERTLSWPDHQQGARTLGSLPPLGTPEELWRRHMSPANEPAVSPHLEARRAALSHNQWEPCAGHLPKAAIWPLIRQEARAEADSEPALSGFLHATVIMHATMDASMAFLLAKKLASPTLLATQLTRLIKEAYEDDPSLLEACVADIQAVRERDPACRSFVHCMTMFKGFQAIQSQRVAHWMWRRGRTALALALQSRMAEAFQVDIHPAAQLGRGLLMDHATGIVIGETAVVGDNVSMLHHVTLGGSGVGRGARHPVIGNGVLLGAGVSVLGPVVIGHCSKVGAGSVVVTDIPPHTVAVGVPAKVVKVLDDSVEPVLAMDQCTDFILDYTI